MRVGLVGTGMVAATHMAALRRAGLAPAWVLGRGRAEAFAAEHGTRAVRAVEPCDFVLLLTPPDARRPFVEACAARGLPVLSEKPLERSHVAAAALVARMGALPFGVVLQHRTRDAVARLRARLPGLGPVRSVDLRVPWWRPQSYYDAPGRGTHARDGGGVLVTQAIHALDVMLHLCGPVASVQATLATAAHAMEAEDFAAAGLRFASGAVGAVMASTTHFPGGPETLTINCDGGSATLEGERLVIATPEGTETHEGDTATGGGADPMAFSPEGHARVIAGFARALREGTPPPIPAAAALPVHALIDAMARASAEGRRVDL